MIFAQIARMVRIKAICKIVAVPGLMFCMAATVHAGRPLMVDDASIAGDKQCQLESWVQNNRNSSEYWVLPACNFSGNLELTLGGARIAGGDHAYTTAVMQGKTLFRPLEKNDWGVGLLFGNQFNPDKSALGDLYASVPLSFSFKDDGILLHLNLGWLHEKEMHRDAMTWGVATEIKFAERTRFSAETYGQNRGNPFFQFGIRHQLIPDRLQIDASYGSRFGRVSSERFFSIGFVLFSDAVLP